VALRLSTAVRNARGNGWLNGTGTSTFDSGVLEIRSGTIPADADTAPTGTVLASITLPADAFAAGSAGVFAKAGTWSDASTDAAGTATWFRFRQSGDLGTTNTTDERVDGTVTATGGGGDITLDNVVIAAAQALTMNSFSFTEPAS
jgi:hypothetical protein